MNLFELLEPYEGKLSRTVLRGEGGSDAADLLDKLTEKQNHHGLTSTPMKWERAGK